MNTFALQGVNFNSINCYGEQKFLHWEIRISCMEAREENGYRHNANGWWPPDDLQQHGLLGNTTLPIGAYL